MILVHIENNSFKVHEEKKIIDTVHGKKRKMKKKKKKKEKENKIENKKQSKEMYIINTV